MIQAHDISFAYKNALILKDLSFEVPRGAFMSIAGPNGVGKTTLLHLLCGLLPLQDGEVVIDQKPLGGYAVATLAKKVALVRQEFTPPFEFSVYETILMARTAFFDQFGFETPEDIRLVREAMDLTDTAHLAERSITHLSGGERQRVFIARAIAQNTPILLLDEPTSHLDLRHQIRIYQLLKNMQTQGKTIVTITHDINLARRFCDRVLLLGPELTSHIGPINDILTPQSLEKVFQVPMTRVLVDGIPVFVPKIPS